MLEWDIALKRRRLFIFNLVVPLALVAPLAFSPAPAAHEAAVYAVLFVMFGTFGSAIPLVRDGRSGLIARLRAAGIAPGPLVFGRSAAAASLDAVQLLPALAVVVLSHGSDPVGAATTALALAVSVWVANLVGVWVAALSRSLAEAALLGAVSALLLLHAAGVFRTPGTGSWGESIERLVPFRLLHHALLSVADGGASAPLPDGAGVAFLVAFLVIAVSTAGAGFLVSALVRSGHE